MLDKFKDCMSKDLLISEIFLVEGDFVGGLVVQGCDLYIQVIFVLCGKIFNVECVCFDKVLGNKEVQVMIQVFGMGIGEEFDIEKVCYYKIVLMVDVDVDGQYIIMLLLMLLFCYMCGLIEVGFVYLVMLLLYWLKWLNLVYEYVFSDVECDVLFKYGLENGKWILKDVGIQCYKGFGEMNLKELWEMMMDYIMCMFQQIIIEDVVVVDEIFSVLMGEDVEL